MHKLKLLPIHGLIILATILAYSVVARLFSISAMTNTIKNRTCFVIDAGHGGIDGGAVSCTGITESELNLEIALRLNDFMRIIGLETTMIRTEDTSVYTEGNTIASQKASDLKERVRIVNENDNSVLLSVHQNHFSDSKYYGGQIFYAANPESQTLAAILQENWNCYLTPDTNRQHKKAEGIYLIKHIENPGVLIECGFLSNYQEEAKLRTTTYQQKICGVIAKSCIEFLNRKGIS